MSEDEEEYWQKSEITTATIRSTAKRNTAMRILSHLNNNSDSLTISEIAEALDIEWETTKHNLLKLMEAGFVEPEEDKMDSRTRYFKIKDKKATEKAIELWEERQRRLKKKEEKAKHKPKVLVEEIF